MRTITARSSKDESLLRRIALGASILALLGGCAARVVPPPAVAPLGDAQRLMADGCWQCLEEALAIAERAAGEPRSAAQARRHAFTTSVLMAVRARELGLPDEPFIARAERWSAGAPKGGPGLAPHVYFDALQLVQGELSGIPPDERDARARERRARWTTDGSVPPARTALSAASPDDLAAHYLALTLDCEDAQARKSLDRADMAARFPMPLMVFRLELCLRTPDTLQRLREDDPRWVDTLFFEGQREMTRYPAPDIQRAAAHFAAAHRHFPTSPAAALALFDLVLSGAPDHRDALLGRLLSLSYLNRHGDAIRTATRLVDLGTYHQGDALYWRAWNRYRTHQLPAAWEDVTAATRVMVSTSVYTLAGFIAYARQWPETAIERLAEAYRLDRTNCEAVWTEGLVHVDKEDWEPAGARFGTASACFAQAADQARAEKAAAERAAVDETVKARRTGAAQQRIDAAEHRRAQAAFNAAGSFARLRRKADALKYLEEAELHPLLQEKAAALRVSVEKLP